MEVQEQKMIERIKTKLQDKRNPMEEHSLVILESILNRVTQDHTLPTAVLLSLLQLVINNQSNQEYQRMDSLLQLINIFLNEIHNVNIIRNIAHKVIDGLREVRKTFRNGIIKKYAIAIFGQVLLAVDIKIYENYRPLVHEILIDEIYCEDQMVRKQVAKSAQILLQNKVDVKYQLSDHIKSVVFENILDNEIKTQQSVQFIQKCINDLQINVKNDILYQLIKAVGVSNDNTKCIIYLCFDEQVKEGIISSNLAESIVKELLDNQVYFNQDSNVKLLLSYSQCLIQTMKKLKEFRNPACDQYFPSVLSIFTEMFFIQTDKINVNEFVQKNIEQLLIYSFNNDMNSYKNKINDPLDNIMEMDLDQSQNQGKTQPSYIDKVISLLEYLLSNRFDSIQKHQFNILSTFFSIIDKEFFGVTESIIEHVLGLGLYDVQEYQMMFGSIIKSMGLETMLTKYRLKMKQQDLFLVLNDQVKFETKTNLWMVPLINRHLKKAEFSVFLKYIYPFIQNLNKLSKLVEDEYLVNFMNTLKQQLWSIFGICYEQDGTTSYDQNSVQNLLDDVVNDWNQYPKEIMKGLELMVCNSHVNMSLQIVFKQIGNKMIPKLAGLYQKDISQSIDVIKQISYYCTADFLDKIYYKNINKLIQTKTVSNKHDLDILIAISHNIDIRSDKIDLSLQFIELFIQQESVQKKVYKYTMLLINKLHKSYHQQIVEIVKRYPTFVSSKHLKIQMYNQLYQANVSKNQNIISDQEKFQYIKQYLPELMIGLRDNNHKTRRISKQFLFQISENFDKNLLKEYISMILAGFASQNCSFKADTIKTLSLIFEEKYSQIEHEFLERVFNMVAMLGKEKNREIFVQIMNFVKMCIKMMNNVRMESILEKVLDVLLKQDEQNTLFFRTQVKFVIGKLVKKMGEQMVIDKTPQEQQRIVKYVVKNQRQEKNKQKKAKKLIDRNMNIVHKALDEKVEKEKKKRARQMEKNRGFQEEIEEEYIDNKQNKKGKEKQDNLLLKYDSNQENFHFMGDQFETKKQQLIDKAKAKKEDLVQYVKGKIVIKEEQQEGGKKRKREGADKYASLENYIQQNDQKVGEKQHRKIVSLKQKQQNIIHNMIESGSTFKNRKGAGDIIKAGKPDPYAFIQLNPKVLNKKFRDKSANAFEGIVNTKGSGSLKGIKNKKFKAN